MSDADSFSPPTVYSEELANRALPLVRRIVDDLVVRFRAWQDAVSRFEYATIKSTASAPDTEADALQAEAGRIAEEIDICVRELDELGVQCRAFDTGFVIFPGERNGTRVRFVWRRGDAAVSEWRDYDTHYTERYLGQPATSPAVYERNSLLADADRLSRPLMIIHGLADDNVVVAHSLRLSSALLSAGRPHTVLPLTGVTHMASQEEVAENLLLLQVDFLHAALSHPPVPVPAA